MDLNPPERSPLSLSRSFYDESMKDAPSPLSRDFYDSAMTKPAEVKSAPATPALYEMASPGEIIETAGAVGEAVIRTPLQIAGAAASAIRGGSREAVADKDSFLTRIIDRANQDSEEFQKKYADSKVVIAPLTKLGLPDDITTGTITRFPQQAAFSAVSAGAGLAVGLSTAAVSGLAAPIAGRAAGMAASGGVAYRMQKDNSTKDLYEKLNATSMKAAGRALTPEQWKTAYDKNEGSLIEQGISEAIPEAIGNLVGFELFFGAAKNVFGKQLAKTTIGKTLDKYGASALGKLLAEQATEQTTETWTQQWQHNIDVEMGLTPGETKRSWTSFDDLRQSNKEVFADILLLSTVMGGAALAGEHVKGKMDAKASAQLVKDVVAENKFGSIPNEFLPAMYEHAQDLSDKRPGDKSLAMARDAFATEMDKRGIDFDMTSKFKEYLKLDAAVKAENATGEGVARWVSLRDEFKEKNISPDLYQGYLAYLDDINKATKLYGKKSEPDRKEFNRLVDAIASRATTFGFPEEVLDSASVEKGGVIRKPLEPAKSAARDILLEGEPGAKRENLTARDILTEGDVNIQSEEDLTPEALTAIDKKLEIAGTGGARKPLNVIGETPGKTLDITEEVKTQDKKQFDLWDTQETGTPSFVRAKVERLFAEGGAAAVLGEYGNDDTVSAYARYRLGRMEKTTPAGTVGAGISPEGGAEAKVQGVEGEKGEEKLADLTGRISRGEISKDFEFPDSYSPMDIHDLWDDLSSVQADIDAKNKPRINELTEERNKLKGDRDAVAKARKKQIDEEIDTLRSESGFVMKHAENAFASAQEKLGLKAVELLKSEGIEVSEKDQDDIYDLVSILSDGRQNEQGWAQPILRQVVDEFKAAKASAAEETPAALAPEVLTTLTGRVLTPPGIRTATNRLATKDAAAADSWLRDEAINEAKAKSDEFNLLQFEGTNPQSLSQADREGMHQYLFGDTKPIFEMIYPEAAPTEIKAAGTGGARGPKEAAEPAHGNTLTVTRTEHVNRSKASAADLAADYKARGLERHLAWDEFIKDRILKPEIDAKVFYALFDKASPLPLAGKSTSEEVSFVPTHRRISSGELVQAESPNENGIAKVITESGKAESDHISNLAPLGKTGGPTEIEAAGTGGARGPKAESITQAANEAATSSKNELPEPTQEQKEAGNYKMGHVNIQGLDISIENPAGSVRKGVDENGKSWETAVVHHYGYIKNTEGKDGDHVDTFIGPNPESTNVFIVDQMDPKTGKFDEHKTLVGFNTEEEGRAGYLANYDKTGPSRIMGITEMPMDQFKEWIKGDTTKRVSTPTPSYSFREAYVEAKEYEAVKEAYSGDRLSENGTIRIPFTHDGHLRTTVAILGAKLGGYAQTWRVTPENQYSGPTYSYKEITDQYDDSRTRGDHTGQLVTYKGEKYVLSDPLHIGIKEEIKAAGTGGARGPKAETVKASETGKASKPVLSATELKSKEEEGKAKAVKKYLLEHIEEAIAARAAYENNKTEDAGPDHVIIDVPMDGKFRIINTVESLEKFKKKVLQLKVTAALNRLPQHSGKSKGKSTDLITKEAEAEVADYWTKRNEFKARYEGIPAEIAAEEARLAKYQELKRKVDDKEITLKQLGEEAKAAGDEDRGPEAWRDSWFGKTPSYSDLKGRIWDIKNNIRRLEASQPEIETAIKEYYPGLAKEMFEGKAMEEAKAPEEKKEEPAAKDSRRISEAIRERTLEMIKPYLKNSDEKNILLALEKFANEALGEITIERLDTGGSHEKGGLSKEDRLYINLWDVKKVAMEVLEDLKAEGLIGKAEENAPAGEEMRHELDALLPGIVQESGIMSGDTYQSPQIPDKLVEDFLSKAEQAGYVRGMAQTKSKAGHTQVTVKRAPDEIKAAGTGGKRGPSEQDEIGARLRKEREREAEFEYRKKHDALLEASGNDKAAAAERFSLEDAKRFLSDLDAVPGDDPRARLAILNKYPELAPKKEDPYTVAVGEIGGKADRAKDRGYEFVYGDPGKGSELYWDMVGIFSGASADKLVEAGITIKKIQAEEAAPAEIPEEPKADIMKEIAEISVEELDALLDTPETEARDNATPPDNVEDAVKKAIIDRDRRVKLPPAKPTKGLDAILADVAKEGVSGAGEALKGLYELFGGASLKSFPGGFNEDTYAKAKPHFETALQHFIKVGKGLREFLASIVQQYGDAIRPFLKQFMLEKMDEVTEEEEIINLDENTGKGEGGARTRRKLTDQEKADKDAAKKALEEKKAKKAAMGEFKNIGYVYDPEKLNAKIKDKPPKSAAKIILDEMVPGKLWAIDFPEDATPGVVRLNGQMQKYFRTFKEFLTENRDRLRYTSGKSIEDKIEHWLTYRGGTIDMLKDWANEYGKAIQPFIDAFNGQTGITNVIGKLQDTLLPGERFGDTGTGTYPNSYSDINSVEAKDKFYALADLLNRNRQTFYSFLTDSWHNLLADENDVLLSEINVNKRGRNKTVVRSGLPDYREGVELKKTEDFNAPFGFKGVGFGEEGWINQEERNRVIPAAYDAFMDLAATIGAPNNGMSLGGELAVQFANLGHKAKGAAAAYFPTVQTINFTRDNGDGTMAHEWGHGLHHLAYTDAKDEIEVIIKTFYHVYDFDAGTRLVDDLLAKDSTFLKRMVSSKKQVRIEAVKAEVTDRFEDTVKKSTDYYSTAQQMDADYTARKQEMWARAFEAYIYDTLAGKNNYLVNDFVAAGRVGGKSGVGTRLVYPSGKERETFNATIKHFLEGLRWEDDHRPMLKDDYVTIEKAHELMLQLQLRSLLEQVEARYKAIWASEPSKDGYFWYRYDETSFGPMMQPDGYDAYDKEYGTGETKFPSIGQNGTGAVAYLTQLHPDDILDYKLTNIQYDGENQTYIAKERGGIHEDLSSDGEEALDEVPTRPDGSPDEGGDVREGDGAGGTAGVPGTREYGKQRGTTSSSEGDSAEGVHPSPAGNYRITDLTLNDPKSVPVRFGLNLSAVKVFNLVESENRTPTDAEKDILAQYSGWGGMSELFAWEPTAAWAGKAELLKAELTDDEIRDAASSSTSSYYTPVPVGQFMWKLAQRLGFEKGVVLDPAVGANGLFLGTMPPDLANGTALQGIEMDILSARIASKLYGLASIENKAFQDVKKPNNRFDLTITNVPFERITPTDLKHNKGGYSLHNYFINKMLNLTAPGALSMMITTSNTLDTIGAHLTEYAGKAQLVGAIRLPSGIYSATQVATDILVFRKHIEGGKFVGIPAEEWTTTGTDESTGLTINNYFLKHPEMVAGKLEKITGRYGNEQLRVAPEGDLQANLERIAAAFPDKIVEREAVKEPKSIDDIISAPGTIKEGGAYINDKNEVCEKVDGEEIKLPVATASEKKKAEIVRGYVLLLDHVRTVLRAQKTETDDEVVKGTQRGLKKAYERFVKANGPVNDPKNHDLFTDYTDSSWVIALEEYDPDTGKVTKIADIFTKNITGIASRPDRADTDHDALAMALDEFGYPNLEYMARLRNSDVASVMAGVGDKIIENPETGFLETMDEYLAGNVKRKLAVAREMAQSNPEYARNVSLLEAAQPPEIPQHRITARIGASWISSEHLADFVKEKMALRHGLRAIFNFNPVSNEWSMTFRREEEYRKTGGVRGYSENKAETQRQIAAAKRSIEATTVWGTERMDFFELMKCALMGKRPQVTYTVDRKQYLDEVATQAAEVKLQDIQIEFGRWLFADTFRADQAVKRFNDLINTSVPMRADGSHLTFPGKSMWMITPKEKEALGVTDALTFYPHQMNATWKYLKNGNLYLGHEVGTGKTVTMALIAMEAKRLRGKKKVLYVTLNDSTMGQAVAEIKNLYPMANILPVRVSTNEQRKQRSLQKIALNDFDIAIMRQQDLDRIGLSPESERVFIEEEIQELREILEEAKRDGARILEQDIQVQLHALEEKLKAPSVYDEAKKKNLFFDDLGIDLMIVDEAHKYKNIPYATRLTRITGLNPAGSPTAKDFFRKTQYLNAQFPKKDGIVLASGTALSNSIAEMYNIQRMLQPQEVKRQGVWSFDRWIANYGDMGSQLEWDATRGERGAYKTVTTNRRIVNAGRLLATAYQNVDSVRADDTPVKRPVIRGGEPQRVKVAPNQYVEDYKRIVRERCAEIEADPKEATYEGVPDNMLRIISNMSKVAIDQRLDHHYANTEMQQDSKIAVASQIMYRRWKEEAQYKGVQLVFADMGIPGKYSDKFKYKTDDEIAKLSPEELTIYNEEMFEHESASTGFNTYEGLKKELVKLRIPENQIAFIHDADHTNKEKKAANLRTLFKKVNAGDIRVLIGSTSKAGTGVNIQGRVSDIHHLDVWWNFSAWEQRNGRGIRAGNLYANEGMPGTYIWNYVTETTVDATRWDKVFAKGKVLNAVLGGDINLDVIEDISDETMSAKMMAAEASGDPLMSTQATLLQQVQGLRFEQAAYLDVVRRSRMDLAAIPGRIEALEKCIADYQHSRDIMDKVTAVRFIGDDRTLVLEKHGKEIAEALEKAVMADTASWTESKKSALLVFGSHTETDVVEAVEGKDGEKKEKKVKKYAFIPLPAKADITGKPQDPFGRRLLISGDILSSGRNLADIHVDDRLGVDPAKRKPTTADIKANISRTVTEFLSYMDASERSAKDTIEELKGNEPKLQKVIDTPWAKVDELATKDKELRQVEAQMAARGNFVGDPTTGIPIDKHKGIVPVLEDVADKDEWSFYDGIIYPRQNPEMGVRAKTDLSRFLKSGKLKPNIASQYNAPDSLQALNGEKPNTPATMPVAYTVKDNETRFWVPAGTTLLTVDPVQWNLLKRILGGEGSWHYDNQGAGERYFVHVDAKGERDAFIWAKQVSYVPQGVKDIAEKVKYSVGRKGAAGGGRMDLKTILSLFPGQQVVQEGDNYVVTLKNGAQATIYGVAEITPNAVSLKAGYKKGLGEGQFVAGSFDGFDVPDWAIIRIVRDNANAPWTLSHESVHWLEKLGVISEMDKATLNARIQKEGKWNKDLSPEENRANWLADFVNRPQPSQTVLAQIWQKIQDFIARIVGIRTAGMIGRELQSGKIFERETRDASPGVEAYGAGYGEGADKDLPRWLGEKVKKAFKKDSIVSILLDFGPIQSGPLDGGCLVVARALKRIEPTGKIITIEGHQEDGTWQAEHYGFELNGVMIDGSGHAPSREVWAKRFAKNESLDRPYRITEGQVESDEIVQDVPTEKKLAAALVLELGGDKDQLPYEINEVYGAGKYDNFGDNAVIDFSEDESWHDIAYREPTRKAIARLNAWLKENQYATVRMYHGTDAGIPVMEEGLKPTSVRTAKSLQSSHGTVSLSLFPGMANQFGRLAYPGKEIAVYQVDILVKNLVPDNDQLRNKRHFGGRTDLGDTLAESIAIGHGAKVRGAVPVDWIRTGEGRPSVKAYDEALSAHAYISPRMKRSLSAQEKTIRGNAYGVKGMDPVVLDSAAKEMAALIPEEARKSSILVPIPGHTGDTAANVALAERIAAITGSRVADVLKRQAGQSQRDARVAGRRTMKPVDFGMVSTETFTGDNIFFVDNVISSGATIRAARDAVGGGKGLVYAKSNPKGEKYAIGTAEQYSVQTDTIDNTSLFPEVNERLKAAKGVKYASLKDRAKDALVTGWEHFTRHFQHLDPETDGAVIDVFRKFQDVPAWAKDETVRKLSGFIGRLSPQGRDVFMMNILLPDMIRDIENGTLDIEDEVELPFGYKNRDQVRQDYDHFRAIAEGSTAIMEALDRRNAFMASLTDQLIEHKLLKKEVANDPAAYFHHQVLAYMNYKENPNWGMSSRDVRTHRKGWQIGRKGSQLDYNTEYVESEFEIISQALTQIETVKSLKEIERLADIKPELEAEAKDKNMATFRRKAFTNPLDDPLLPFRVKIAMGFQKLAKLFTTENDMPALPMEFDDVIEHIVDQEEQRRAAKEDEIEFDPVPHPRMFALLNYLVNHGGPGSMPAAMIFKAIAARNAFIKQVVGKDWVTYRDLIPEGYVAHKPETGSTFYFTNSIADQALTQVLAGHKNLPDAVRQVLARGRDEEWVVKEGISKTLNEFRPAMSDSLPAKMSKDMLTTWKQWILMNPFRVIKYNINNMSGDLDIVIAYDPRIITDYFAQAFKDLWAASRGNASEALMDELSAMTKRGVVGSGMTAMDIPELGDVKSVKGLVDFFDGKSKGALTKWWTMNKKLSTLRENILRLAANRYFLDRLGRGEIVYGASRKEEVDAIANREDKAAKLARELIGDYGNISHAGQYIRERMIPFYSWCVPEDTEILTRYGWKKHSELQIGEEVMSYNMAARETEWQPLLDFTSFAVNEDLVTLSNVQGGHKFRFTKDHRVPVIEQYKDKRKMVLAKDLKQHHKIPLVAPHKFEDGSALSPKDAALLGWLVTDRYFRKRMRSPKSFEAMIYQKKPEMVEVIRSKFADDITSESIHPETKTICFRLSTRSLAEIRKVFSSKEDLPRIVTQLSKEACESMYEAMMMAEGNVVAHKNFATFPQNDGPVMDAFQILCYRLGMAGHIRNKNSNGKSQKSLYIKRRDRISVHKWIKGTERYVGKVWCPKTANGTWVMRQDGKVMITGNCEINAPRYVRLFRNLKDEGGGGIGALGGVLAWKTTKLAVKATALMGLVMLWNAAFFPEEEDELQETGREQLHLILGRRTDGSIITIRFQGALSDALSWFGMNNPVEQAKKVVSGTKGVGDLAKDVVKAAPLRLFQGFRPEPKLLYETLSGQSFFPDPLHPRPIRDTTEHILRTFSLDRIYNQASGKPKQGGTWATQMYRDIQSLALNEADPGEQAYYTSRKYIFDWLDKQGKEKPAAMPTNRSNALYYYKQALKFGDFDTAEKYLKKYQGLGGKLHDVQGSIRRVHPLASLRLADRFKFKASLSPEQRETLSVATAWYKKHYVDTYREQRTRASQ